jgi:hypothetical protein
VTSIDHFLTSIEIEQEARRKLAVAKAHGRALYEEQGGDYDRDMAFFETVIAWAQTTLAQVRLSRLTTELAEAREREEKQMKAMEACLADLIRYSPPHWRNKTAGEQLARNAISEYRYRTRPDGGTA